LGKTAIAVVADGHGAEEHFRSDRGSRFAVEAALQCIRKFTAIENNVLPDPSASIKTLEKSIIAAWHKKVADDVKSDKIDGDIFSPYGTTLIAAAITIHYCLAIQIGDGKCVFIDKNHMALQPIPWDDRCFLNRTTSLCDDDSLSLFRHFYSEVLPLAVFMGSDGIDDSFPVRGNEEHLAGFYQKIYKNFIREGIKKGEKELREMLPLFTQKGSGDDVSIAGTIRSL
jgi:hypothetical protein